MPVNPPKNPPNVEVSVLTARQIPLGVLTDPLPLRYFEVISTAVPVPLAVKVAPLTFKYLFALVTFMAEDAVKLPRSLG